MSTDLPSGWTWTALGELGTEVRGQVSPEPEIIYDLYSVPAFKTGIPELVEGSSIKSGKRLVQEDDVLLCKINPRINRVWSVGRAQNRPQIASTEYLVLRLHEPRMTSFLRHYLSSPRFREWIKLAVEGATGSHTRAKSGPILEQMVPVPPLADQERIVAAIDIHFSRLDAASDAITVARARIEATSRGVLVEAFAGRLTPQDPTDEPASDLVSRVAVSEPAKSVGRRTLPSSRRVTDRLPPNWVWARFDEIATTQLGKMLSAKSRQGKAPVPYLRNQNVQWHRIDLSDVASMDFTDCERVKFQLRPGDLLICEGGEVGRAAMWTQPSVEMCFQKALHRVRARPGIEARWIEHFMRWSAQTGRFEEHAQGSTIAHLPQRDLRALMIPIPPSNEQRRIVATIEEHFSRLDATGASIAAAQARIEATRRSVLVDAFAGRLTP